MEKDGIHNGKERMSERRSRVGSPREVEVHDGRVSGGLSRGGVGSVGGRQGWCECQHGEKSLWLAGLRRPSWRTLDLGLSRTPRKWDLVVSPQLQIPISYCNLLRPPDLSPR